MTPSVPDPGQPEPVVRGRSRRSVRRRAGAVVALVLLVVTVNTPGATLGAGDVAGPSRVPASTLQPGPGPSDAGPDVTAGDAIGDLPPGPESTVVTDTAGTEGGAGADREPDMILPGRRNLAATVAAVAADGPVVAHVVRRVSTTRPLVALTFDDGYNPAAIRQIVAILERERVTATFFVNGMYLSWAPDVWRRIAADGFAVGNHTYRHTNVRTLTASQIAADLARAEAAWESLTGTTMVPLFRPPYGRHSAATDLAAALAGYPTVVMWDTTGGDTAWNPTLGDVVAGATRGKAGSIVLLHAGPSITPLALPAIIASYRARGFTFVTVPELLASGG